MSEGTFVPKLTVAILSPEGTYRFPPTGMVLVDLSLCFTVATASVLSLIFFDVEVMTEGAILAPVTLTVCEEAARLLSRAASL